MLIFLLIFNSCKKEDNKKTVTSGVYDATFNFHEFSPPFKVNLKKDTVNHYSFGADSIDFNLDRNFDLVISQRLTDKSVSRIDQNNFPYCRLQLKNGLEVATRKETYPIGLGDYSSIDWVDSLHYNTRIDNISEWSATNTSRFMWAVAPTSFLNTNGCWYYFTNVEMYIGLRMKTDSGYKFGWMKVNEISRENIFFFSYAMEK
ncbi:MAG TPA: hypothetical protein DCL77_06365 [Prolixibacteraceae bacterium]|nr:hypothetical protein [Prolixibacteraceae bacterium]